MKLAIAFSLLVFATTSLAQPSRIVRDEPRNNLWVLDSAAVYLHDAKTRALKQRFELPGWMNASEAYACSPDLAVDAHGAAVVTSNIVPVVWRVEPSTAQVTRHELALDADNDKDVGFTKLVYARHQRAFIAVSATYGSIWRIDPQLRSAQKVGQTAAPERGCLQTNSL